MPFPPAARRFFKDLKRQNNNPLPEPSASLSSLAKRGPPNNPLTGEWSVTIVNQILKQMPALAKPQSEFLTFLFAIILARRGRCNFRNMSRCGDYPERTIARQFRREFAWPLFNQLLIVKATQPDHALIAAHDASFIPKSGKHTFGLDHFFNSCAGRAERGLEISTLAVVNVTNNCACILAAAQTPPSEALLREDKEQTRIDFYVKQLHEHSHLLPETINYLAADGFYAKQNTSTACGLAICTKSSSCVATPICDSFTRARVSSDVDDRAAMMARSTLLSSAAFNIW
jgi:hypothetical protein